MLRWRELVARSSSLRSLTEGMVVNLHLRKGKVFSMRKDVFCLPSIFRQAAQVVRARCLSTIYDICLDELMPRA